MRSGVILLTGGVIFIIPCAIINSNTNCRIPSVCIAYIKRLVLSRWWDDFEGQEKDNGGGKSENRMRGHDDKKRQEQIIIILDNNNNKK
jgi:hypothetical protein